MSKKYKKKLKKQLLKIALASSKYLIDHMVNGYRVDADFINTLNEWEKLMNFTFDNIERFENWEKQEQLGE